MEQLPGHRMQVAVTVYCTTCSWVCPCGVGAPPLMLPAPVVDGLTAHN